jgi:hypothetical protein
MWAGAIDEIVPITDHVSYQQQLIDHGYRHELDNFPINDHLLFALLNEFGPGKEFLDGTTTERNPRHVTYRRVPEFDNTEFGLTHDKVHWISDIQVADDVTRGLVDIRSRGHGEAPPIPEEYRGPGTEPKPHVKRGIRWLEGLKNPAAKNRLEVSLEGVDSVTVRTEKARLDVTRPITLEIDTTTSATITLVSGAGSVDVDVLAGETERTVTLCEARAQAP